MQIKVDKALYILSSTIIKTQKEIALKSSLQNSKLSTSGNILSLDQKVMDTVHRYIY